MVDAVRVLEDIGMTRRVDVWSALRTLLVHRKDDLPLFDEAFEVFWRQRKDRMSSLDLRSMGEQRRYRRVEAGPPPPGQSTGESDAEAQDPEEQYDRVDLTRTFSAREVLREKDFAEFHAGGDAAGQAVDGFAPVESWSTSRATQGAGKGACAGYAEDAEG